jgi:hypothetical protein
MADENTFDAELNAIMGVEPQAPAQETAPAPAGNAAPANSAPAEKVWEAGGRKWNDPAQLAKAHDALVREMGTRNKDWAELKELRKVKEDLSKDPEFAAYFRNQVEAYQKMRQAGQSKTTAAKNSDLPPEVVAKIERADRLADQIELEREENALVRKFGLKPEQLKEVGDYSLANGGIPLEQAYKQLEFDRNYQRLAEAREREAAKRKEVSRSSGPTPSHLAPSSKSGPSLKSDADWRAAAGKELGKYFSTSE